MTVQIIPMRQCDTAAVAALEMRCFVDPWSERSIAAELENPLSLWLVALDGEQLAGYIGSQTVCGEADMMNVAVAPEARRQGIAQALLDALWTALREKQVTALTLEVRASNSGAIALYEKNGFSEIGRRPNYYRHPKEDALIMQKWEDLT